MIIRKAESRDLDDVIRLYRAGLAELGEDYSDSLTMNKVLTSFYLAPCFLLEIDGIIHGIAGLTVVTISHNGVASLVDYMFYISPEKRNIKNLNALVQKAKDFAWEQNMSLRVNFIVDSDLKRKARLLKMNDFDVVAITGEYNG